jgi:mannose-6-phosphate isomerase-like protein (cupin superfamily)
MFHILHRHNQRKGKIASVEFEGEPYRAGLSFFLGNLAPGKGPGLHKHPYSETCIVLSGQAAMVVDGQEVVAGFAASPVSEFLMFRIEASQSFLR